MSKVKDEKLVDFTEIQLREIFTKAGLNSQDIDKAIADYIRYRESELSRLSILSYKDLQSLGAEALTKEIFKLKQGGEILEGILRDYLRYIKYKKEIAETYQESKDWLKVFNTCVYLDVNEAQESFIDYVEEAYQTKIKDVKHLQKLTGITHIDTWDKKTGEYITPDSEEEAKKNAIRELEETLINSKYSKYYRALEKAIREGAKYKDLLKIDPKDYGLPEDWGKDKYSSILEAINSLFFLGESLMASPGLRAVATELEAPYSVIMDSYKLYSY